MNDAHAIDWQGLAYQKGLECLSRQDFSGAYKCFSQASELPLAQYEIGRLHEEERLPDSTLEAALLWLNRSANGGFYLAKLALVDLAMGFRNGKKRAFVEDDEIRAALLWVVETACRGYADAHYFLAELYRTGQVVEQSDSKAAYWCEGAANAGMVVAQYEIGRIYESGIGVDQNFDKALNWYEKIAEQGDGRARDKLSNPVFGVFDCDPDHWITLDDAQIERHIPYLKRIAGQYQNRDAQYFLGELYAQGRSVDVNPAIAALWYEQASANGHTKAKERLLTLQQAAIIPHWSFLRVIAVGLVVLVSSIMIPLTRYLSANAQVYRKIAIFMLVIYTGLALLNTPYLTLESVSLICAESGLLVLIFYGLKRATPLGLKKLELFLGRHLESQV